MTAHAPVSGKRYFPCFSIKIRTARQQLFSSIDCFDALEHGNECCGPSRSDGKEDCATSGLKSALKSGALMSASVRCRSKADITKSGHISANATSEPACPAFALWYRVICLTNGYPEGLGVIRAQARYIDPRAANDFGCG